MAALKFTSEQIIAAYNLHNGNMVKAAKSLNMTRQGFVDRAQRLGCGIVSRYVVTNAVNNTPVHGPFWRSLQHYISHNNVKRLYVIPSPYKNPSAMRMTEPIWYTEDVRQYLVEEEVTLNAQVVLLADIPVQPTAVSPVSAKEAHTGGRWAIIGHPQIQMRMVPTPLDKTPGMLHTTGSCCVKNYSKSNAGKKAQLHHSYGALVIECVNDVAYIRELIAGDDGVFYDINHRYTPKGVEEIDSVPALITGDEHYTIADREVLDTVYYNSDSLVATLRPREIIRPDVLDFYARSHHHQDPLQNFVKFLNGTDDVRDEIERTLQFIVDTTPEYATSKIVASNHNEAFDKWLRESDPRKDPRNARFFHEMQAVLYRIAEEERTHEINAFERYAREVFKVPEDKVQFLTRKESHLICDIDVSQHSDIGANGARGSITMFAKGAYKSVIQHSHSPGIDKGCWQVGALVVNPEYVRGLSSHAVANCVIYPNGKRAFLFVVNGRFRG